jgi:phosphatidylinositol kinase/protein kinase (PI-3  family)
MNVLRDNKDSVMAMLEAFVYDPLISWKLLGPGKDEDPILSDAASIIGVGVSPVSKISDVIQEDDAHSIAGTDSDAEDHEKEDTFNILSPSAAGEGLTRRDSIGNEDGDGLNEDINSR